jgi:putative tryptophan/tyrosine transport system substrate-binding protein
MRFDQLKRREFITLLGGAAAAWPIAARAQQPALPVVGLLDPRSSDATPDRMRGFRQGLRDIGFVEGENVAIDYRFAEGQFERLPELAAELVRHPVSVIATIGGDVVAIAAKKATSTIPVVFTSGGDPIQLGLVGSFNRPGGNVTAVSVITSASFAKRSRRCSAISLLRADGCRALGTFFPRGAPLRLCYR